jgi:putative transposase
MLLRRVRETRENRGAWLACLPSCRCHLMTNHFDLLVQTPDADLAVGMHRLNSTHANYFNRRYDHVGHLFQSRYSAEVIECESHLLETCRYVVLNPVRQHLPTAGPLAMERLSRDRRLYLAARIPRRRLGRKHFGSAPRRTALRYVEFVADRIVRRGRWVRVQGPGP